MISEYRQLIEQIVEQTGVQRPELLEPDSPLLEETALRGKALYLVGLIGGKDVGKSSLVNALAGQEITARTAWGPGTEIVVAYAHEAQAAELESLLEREVPGQYRIATHQIEQLRRQALLDLPDIDSHYARHIEVTRRMLRHMLYPIWLQSVEKYADRRPRELLAAVSAGNAPGNFIFALNKVDQAVDREGEAAVRELADDYARRIAGQLGMDQPPRVWLLSAIHPERYDLPELRKLLSVQKSEQSLGQSQQWAAETQSASLARWIDEQRLEQRLAALERVEASAQEELAARVAGPLLERVIPRMAEDPAHRLALGDELMQQRVARWPIVNMVHVLIGPALSLLRLRLPAEQQRGLGGAQPLVEAHLRDLSGSRGTAGRTLSELIQSTFAQLQQAWPPLGAIYRGRKLWEPLVAEEAADELRLRLADTIERQRSLIRTGLSSGGPIGAMARWFLTIGAVIWFPFAQPILQAWMEGSAGSVAYLVVQVLGVSYLLKNVAFLAIYFALLWLVIKWDTQRRIDRWLARYRGGANLDPTLSLPAQVADWGERLLEPIRQARVGMQQLVQRAAELGKAGRQQQAA